MQLAEAILFFGLPFHYRRGVLRSNVGVAKFVRESEIMSFANVRYHYPSDSPSGLVNRLTRIRCC